MRRVLHVVFIRSSRFGYFLDGDRQYEVTLAQNNAFHARFVHHKPTPRDVLSLIDAFFVCDVAVSWNMRAPHPAPHSNSYSKIEVRVDRYFLDEPLVVLLILAVFFHIYSVCTLLFRSPLKPFVDVMFENMILAKRLRLGDPAMPAPSGMHSDFVHPTNLKTEGLVLMTFCLILSALVVSMRMWTKCCVIRKMFLEDCKSINSPPLEFLTVCLLVILGVCCLVLVRLVLFSLC